MAVLTKGCTAYAQSEGNRELFPSVLTVLTDLIDLIDLIPFPPHFPNYLLPLYSQEQNYGRIFHV